MEQININNPLLNPVLLASLVENQAQSIVSKTLIKLPGGNLTVFAFDAGQGLSEHTAPFDALVIALAGKAEIVLGGEIKQLNNGEALLMPAGIPHALKALEAFKMLLVMIKA